MKIFHLQGIPPRFLMVKPNSIIKILVLKKKKSDQDGEETYVTKEKLY